MADDITEEVTVGSTPGSPNGILPALPGTKVTLKASPERQYIAGGPQQFYTNMPRALPWALDDLTRDFGSDIYSRMLFDPQVRSVLNVYKASVIEDGFIFNPAVESKTEDGYALSRTLHTDLLRMIDTLSSPLHDTIWDMLDAAAHGNSVAEQVFHLDAGSTGKQQYMLKTIAVRPIDAVAFVVDAYLNVIGILGRIPGEPFSVQQGTLLTNIQDTPNLLPRSKFAVLTFRPKNGDPRGTSILRPAYDPWNMKVQLKAEYLKYLTQFATPSLVGYTAEMAEQEPLLDAAGEPMTDSAGNIVLQTPEELLLAAMANFANGTAIALPNGSLIQPLQVSGSGQAFIEAFQLFDLQITKAVLSQILATEEGQHQSRASSGTHKDVLDTISRQGKRPLEYMMQHDIIDNWVLLNYGADAVKLAPRAVLPRSKDEDLPQLWAAAARLRASDYLHVSQFAGLDEKLSLPPRTNPDGSSLAVNEMVTVKEDGRVGPPDTEDDDPNQPTDDNLDKGIDHALDTTPGTPQK